MNRLKAVRETRGLSQRALSRETGIEQPTISLIERSERSRKDPHKAGATPAQAAILARFFGHAVTEAELLYPADYTTPFHPAAPSATVAGTEA